MSKPVTIDEVITLLDARRQKNAVKYLIKSVALNIVLPVVAAAAVVVITNKMNDKN